MKPFKVVCVTDKNWLHISGPRIGTRIESGPKKGNPYTVTGTYTDATGTWYMLAEFVYSKFGYWDARYFRRLDEYPDATSEILKDFQPDKVEQEVFNPIPQTAN